MKTYLDVLWPNHENFLSSLQCQMHTDSSSLFYISDLFYTGTIRPINNSITNGHQITAPFFFHPQHYGQTVAFSVVKVFSVKACWVMEKVRGERWLDLTDLFSLQQWNWYGRISSYIELWMNVLSCFTAAPNSGLLNNLWHSLSDSRKPANRKIILTQRGIKLKIHISTKLRTSTKNWSILQDCTLTTE